MHVMQENKPKACIFSTFRFTIWKDESNINIFLSIKMDADKNSALKVKI